MSENVTLGARVLNRVTPVSGNGNSSSNGKLNKAPSPNITPNIWFKEKYPSLVENFGDPINEEVDKNSVVLPRAFNEDFIAATLTEAGAPSTPTVFLPSEDKFLTYNTEEGIFVHQREAILQRDISNLFLKCARDCQSPMCDTRNLQFRFRTHASVVGIIRKLRGLAEKPSDYFASDLTKYIPCKNGMLQIEGRKLLAFSPSFRRRNKLSAEYTAGATCDLFLNQLLRVALDDADIDLLQRWCGLALIGENIAQKILLLVGTAGGGKGTFIRVLSAIIGQQNVASLRPQLLGERVELGRFLGRTLLYGADVSDNFLDVRGASILKSLTGGDPVTLEFKGSNEAPCIVCKFNVIATCNSRLKVHLEGDAPAWKRRLSIIEYNKPKPQKVIADLDQIILQREASGVLNWMLEGLDKLRADGWQLLLDSNQQGRVDNLLLESDSQAVFAQACLQRDDEKSLTIADCFAAYVEFCTSQSWEAASRNRFSHVIIDEVVRRFGLTTRNDIRDAGGKAQRGWKGLSLTENSQPSEKKVSETSENHTQSGVSDSSDTLFPVSSENFLNHTREFYPGAAYQNAQGEA